MQRTRCLKDNKTLSVNIPAGVDNGDKVRLSEEWMNLAKTYMLP